MSDVQAHWIEYDGFDDVDDQAAPTFCLSDIVGTSPGGINAAIEAGLAKMSATVHDLRWFEVLEIRGSIVAGRPHPQVRMKVGFHVKP